MEKTMSIVGGLDMYDWPNRYESDEPPFGRKVRYRAKGGWDTDTGYANRYFKEGDILTVREIYVNNWHSYVEFIEEPGRKFNSVMFEDVN